MERVLMIEQAQDPDLVLKYVEHTRTLLAHVNGYPDIVLKNLEQHLNQNKKPLRMIK